MRTILEVARRGFLLALVFHWSAAALAGSALDVDEPYAPAVVPGQTNGTVYMRVHNPGAAAVTLVGARSDAAAAVELHSHSMEGGIMKMRRIERITIPPQSSLSFEPGGLHLMLIGLKRTLSADDRLTLTLDLEDGTAIDVEVPVRQGVAAEHRQP